MFGSCSLYLPEHLHQALNDYMAGLAKAAHSSDFHFAGLQPWKHTGAQHRVQTAVGVCMKCGCSTVDFSATCPFFKSHGATVAIVCFRLHIYILYIYIYIYSTAHQIAP